MKESLAISLHHTNTITILKLVIDLISSSISILRVLAFVALINICPESTPGIRIRSAEGTREVHTSQSA